MKINTFPSWKLYTPHSNKYNFSHKVPSKILRYTAGAFGKKLSVLMITKGGIEVTPVTKKHAVLFESQT